MTPQRSEPPRLFALIPAAIALIAALNLSVPYFSLAPGPATGIAELIGIEGVPSSQLNGRLLLTTVSLGEVTMAEAIGGWLDPDIAVIPRSALVPSGTSNEEIERVNTVQMTESQVLAAAAALSFLGYDVTLASAGVRVEQVVAGAPAEGVLRQGDVIVGAGGVAVLRKEELIQRIEESGLGAEILLRVRRGVEELDLTVRTTARSEEPNRPVIGVVIADIPKVELPIAISIDSMGIGGPSAGLMFAVGIVDLLDQDDLTKGRTIAGTGTITFTGDVGPVGGVEQKIVGAREAGAELFLVPEAELDIACARARDLRVVGIANLQEAIAALRDPAAATKVCE